MIAAPYKQLLWKEYRAIRGFWIALFALALGLELLVVALSTDVGWAGTFVYNVALAAPVFFAVGCIGTAFALEKEEGTFEWLQASPVTDAQVLVSKLALCVVGTVGMFALLWPLSALLSGARVPEAQTLTGMLGLWLVAALEAIAWGLFFSLRSVRPLAAILLALFVSSTITHLAGSLFVVGHASDFEFGRYLKAAPLRLLILVPVVVADVVLGLRWLSERESDRQPRRKWLPLRRTVAAHSNVVEAAGQLNRRDGGQMLGRLLWQQMRQSRRLMLLLVGAQVIISLLTLLSGFDEDRVFFFGAMIGGAALMGACAFLPDQERRSYRFFVEHNAAPRYVWLSRVLPWALVAALATLVCVGLWTLGPDFRMLLSYRERGGVRWYLLWPLLASVAISALAFAGGQWVSMLIRSGLLSGLFSLLLAGVLTGWTVLVLAGGASWQLFVLPLLPVFLFATWLRAPDWILENTSWPARAKAAAVVLAPALLMGVGFPMARLSQVKEVGPGFNQQEFLSAITPAALETGQLYRTAGERLGRYIPQAQRTLEDPIPRLDDDFEVELKANQQPLELVIEATGRPTSCLADPAKLDNWPVLVKVNIIRAICQSGQAMEAEGQLDDALDRYFLAFTAAGQMSSHVPNFTSRWGEDNLAFAFNNINFWAAQPGQTPARLQAAVHRLEKLDLPATLNSTDALKSNLILSERLLAGDQRVVPVFFASDTVVNSRQVRALFLLRLVPWEIERERRLVNQFTADGLRQIKWLREAMQRGEDVTAQVYPDNDNWNQSLLSLTNHVQHWSQSAEMTEVRSEVQRRATLLRVACQAYRVEHGKLPEKLEDLVETGVLRELPKDPFSGRPFVYFTRGIPEPRTDLEKREFQESETFNWWMSERLQPGVPSVWSPGISLMTEVWNPPLEQPGEPVVYYTPRGDRPNFSNRLSDYQAWLRGLWFPIPAAAEKPAEPPPEG